MAGKLPSCSMASPCKRPLTESCQPSPPLRRDCHDSTVGESCYWWRDESGGRKQILKAGNKYTLRWSATTNDDVQVVIMEHDPGVADGWDDHCMVLASSLPSRSSSANSFEFEMPYLLDLDCTKSDGLGGTSGKYVQASSLP